jgi:hypothetical protein
MAVRQRKTYDEQQPGVIHATEIAKKWLQSSLKTSRVALIIFL